MKAVQQAEPLRGRGRPSLKEQQARSDRPDQTPEQPKSPRKSDELPRLITAEAYIECYDENLSKQAAYRAMRRWSKQYPGLVIPVGRKRRINRNMLDELIAKGEPL